MLKFKEFQDYQQELSLMAEKRLKGGARVEQKVEEDEV